eukprot:CAMPEP_0170554316 /NCGR_PEP_ID=MMETSP0211-20121228/12166_1 /TAXON_ID=311385 /ORGANISM="Pseudokeronopsis sp., Strain OXSARD2" /LENGTH=76 /DNA_ID=CAMNT_0010863271 /DNA_START=517 /DNA_END=744 /DNA_ORIENTATION=-
MSTHIDEFDDKYHSEIRAMNFLQWLAPAFALTMGIVWIVSSETNFLTALFEWLSAFSGLSYMVTLSLTSDYYDGVF